MSYDLLIAVPSLLLIAALLFALSCFCCSKLSHRQLNGVALFALAILAMYLMNGWYRPWVARWLPVSSLIIWGNWLPLWAASFGAIVFTQLAAFPYRRLVFVTAILGTGSFAAIYPLLGNAPNCGESWDADGTCLQTTNHTCSAACAATLLSRVGIQATEQEMAQLCLTREGTNWQGLYRGLKLKTAGTPYDVQVCSGDWKQLQAMSQGPMIVSVGLPQFGSADPAFTREFGWVPGVNHSVIVRYFDQNGSAIVSDPTQARCRESWAPETLQTLYRGIAFRLVKRAS